jgi:hypothetical protein
LIDPQAARKFGKGGTFDRAVAGLTVDTARSTGAAGETVVEGAAIGQMFGGRMMTGGDVVGGVVTTGLSGSEDGGGLVDPGATLAATWTEANELPRIGFALASFTTYKMMAKLANTTIAAPPIRMARRVVVMPVGPEG